MDSLSLQGGRQQGRTPSNRLSLVDILNWKESHRKPPGCPLQGILVIAARVR